MEIVSAQFQTPVPTPPQLTSHRNDTCFCPSEFGVRQSERGIPFSVPFCQLTSLERHGETRQGHLRGPLRAAVHTACCRSPVQTQGQGVSLNAARGMHGAGWGLCLCRSGQCPSFNGFVSAQCFCSLFAFCLLFPPSTFVHLFPRSVVNGIQGPAHARHTLFRRAAPQPSYVPY